MLFCVGIQKKKSAWSCFPGQVHLISKNTLSFQGSDYSSQLFNLSLCESNFLCGGLLDRWLSGLAKLSLTRDNKNMYCSNLWSRLECHASKGPEGELSFHSYHQASEKTWWFHLLIWHFKSQRAVTAVSLSSIAGEYGMKPNVRKGSSSMSSKATNPYLATWEPRLRRQIREQGKQSSQTPFCSRRHRALIS